MKTSSNIFLYSLNNSLNLYLQDLGSEIALSMYLLWYRSLLACKIGSFGNPCIYLCIYVSMYVSDTSIHRYIVSMYGCIVAYIKLCIYVGGGKQSQEMHDL